MSSKTLFIAVFLILVWVALIAFLGSINISNLQDNQQNEIETILEENP